MCMNGKHTHPVAGSGELNKIKIKFGKGGLIRVETDSFTQAHHGEAEEIIGHLQRLMGGATTIARNPNRAIVAHTHTEVHVHE